MINARVSIEGIVFAPHELEALKHAVERVLGEADPRWEISISGEPSSNEFILAAQSADGFQRSMHLNNVNQDVGSIKHYLQGWYEEYKATKGTERS